MEKGEEEKQKLQKEIASIAKNLQRAKQSQQFPSAIAVFQQQLDVANDELAKHVKSIAQHRSLSNQAQDKFAATLSQPNPQPQLEEMPERVERLESQLKAMLQGPDSAAGGQNPMKANAEVDALQARDQNFIALKEKLQKVENALENPNGLQEALEYMKKIANSVAHQSKRNGQFTAKISSLEDEVKAAGKSLEDRNSSIRKMVDTVENEMKNSNTQLEQEIASLDGKMKTMKDEVKGKFSAIECDLQSLKTQAPYSKQSVLANVSELETDLEVQRKQAMEQITAQEDLVASLINRQQNSENGKGPSPGVATRLLSLEQKLQTHDGILNKIKSLHSEVDGIRLSELEAVRKSQQSSEALLETRHNTTFKNLENLSKQQGDLNASIARLQTGLETGVKQLQANLQTDLNGFESRLTALSGLSESTKKCENLIETHSKGIRSLEQRWANITTGDLVTSMARVMQEMYPSVDHLSQQLTAYRHEIQSRISALKTETDKAQTDAQKALAIRDKSEAAQESPQQLKDLLQKVNDLTSELAPINQTVKDHADQLKDHSEKLDSNVRVRTDMQNQVANHYDLIMSIDAKIDEKLGDYDNLTESMDKIEPLATKLDGHILQLENVQKEIKELTKASMQRNASEAESAKKMNDRISQLQELHKTVLTKASEERKANENEDSDLSLSRISQLQELQETVERLAKASKERNVSENKDREAVKQHAVLLEKFQKDVEGLTKSSEERNASEKEDREMVQRHVALLQDLRKTVKELSEATNQADAVETSSLDFDDLSSRLKVLEARVPNVSDEKFKRLDDGLEGLEKELNDLELGFKGIEESMRGYLRRLRNAEDAVKTMKAVEAEAKNSVVFDKPMEQQFSPYVRSNSGASTPHTSIASTVPKGPPLGDYQTVQVNGRGECDSSNPSNSNHFAKPARQSSLTPSGASSSHLSPYKGKSAEPRQVQNLKGKRRMSSATLPEDDGDTPSSSPAIESSPAPSSSGPASFGQGSSQNNTKRKKKAAQAEENARTMKRAKKRKFSQES